MFAAAAAQCGDGEGEEPESANLQRRARPSFRASASDVSYATASTKKEEEEDHHVNLVDSQRFSLFIGFTVVLSGIQMGIEVDNDLGVVGLAFSCTFTTVWFTEMVLRMRFNGIAGYFSSKWNWFDCSLVLLSISIDVVMLSLSASQMNEFRLLTILRLARLTRLMKLFVIFEELWYLVQGLVSAVRLLFWVMILLLMAVFVSALFTTSVVGKECDSQDGFGHWTNCRDMFGSMGRSMFTLFQIVTMESWSMAIARPVIKRKPEMALFFVAFLFATTFGLFNVVVGVIVEQTLKSSTRNEAAMKREEERKEAKELDHLRSVFENADADGSGFVTAIEFAEVCEDFEVRKLMMKAGFHIDSARHAKQLFEVLDADSDGQVSISEFIDRGKQLKQEGRALFKDQTQLLVELRAQARALSSIIHGMADAKEPHCHSVTEVHGTDALHSFCKVDSDEVLGPSSNPSRGGSLLSEVRRLSDRLDAMEKISQQRSDQMEAKLDSFTLRVEEKLERLLHGMERESSECMPSPAMQI